MRQFKRMKGHVLISVEPYGNTVVLTDTRTGEKLGDGTFSDPVQALMAADKLYRND